VGIRCADHATPQLALTSPTSSGRSVGIVRLRTTTTEFSFFFGFTIFACYHLEELVYEKKSSGTSPRGSQVNTPDRRISGCRAQFVC
jgi:hypothetical protein